MPDGIFPAPELNDAPPAALVAGLLLSNSITMVSAEPFTGKSMLTLDLALALASGQSFLGHPTDRRRTVVYVAKDSPRWDIASQFHKLRRGRGLALNDFIGSTDEEGMFNTHGTIDMWFRCFDAKTPKSVDIQNKAFLDELSKFHEDGHDEEQDIHGPIQILIIDSLRAIYSGDENDSQHIAMLFDLLNTIRARFRCSIIITHHSAKAKFGVQTSHNYSARGSSAITGYLDNHWVLKRSGKGIYLNFAKGRGAHLQDDYLLYKQVDVENVEGEALVLEPQQSGPEVAETLLHKLAKGEMDRAAMARCFSDVPKEKAVKMVDNALQRLRMAGKIRPGSKRGLWRSAVISLPSHKVSLNGGIDGRSEH